MQQQPWHTRTHAYMRAHIAFAHQRTEGGVGSSGLGQELCDLAPFVAHTYTRANYVSAQTSYQRTEE